MANPSSWHSPWGILLVGKGIFRKESQWYEPACIAAWRTQNAGDASWNKKRRRHQEEVMCNTIIPPKPMIWHCIPPKKGAKQTILVMFHIFEDGSIMTSSLKKVHSHMPCTCWTPVWAEQMTCKLLIQGIVVYSPNIWRYLCGVWKVVSKTIFWMVHVLYIYLHVYPVKKWGRGISRDFGMIWWSEFVLTMRILCTHLFFIEDSPLMIDFLYEHHSFQGSKTWSRSISSRFEIWQKRPHPGYFNGFKRVVKNDEHFRPIFVIKSSLTVFKPFQRHHKDSVSESWQLKPPLLVAFLSMLWRTAKHRTTLPGYIFGLDLAPTLPNVSMEKFTWDCLFSFLNGLLFVVLASQFIPQWFILAHLWCIQMPLPTGYKWNPFHICDALCLCRNFLRPLQVRWLWKQKSSMLESLVSHQLIPKWYVSTRKSSLPVGLKMIDPWLEF